MKLLTAAQMREAEISADLEGINSAVLMGNAGTAAADFVFAARRPSKAAVICGKGNNGGDGFAMALRLAELACEVTIVLACRLPSSPAALLFFERAELAGIRILNYFEDPYEAAEVICSAEVIVDAVYGIGFSGSFDEDHAGLFSTLNSVKAAKFALDIPSGCLCDNGAAEAEAFFADVTLAFSAAKPAHFIYPAAERCGEVRVLDIGIPEQIIDEALANFVVGSDYVRSVFPARGRFSNKSDFGRVLVAAGSPGMTGAAKLCAKAASRCGAGIVELFTDRRIAGAVSADLTVQLTNFYNVETALKEQTAYGSITPAEAKRIATAAAKADCAAVGCGWGYGADRREAVLELLGSTDIPVVLDADGLRSFEGRMGMLEPYGARLVLTPHSGEMARILGVEAEAVQADRLGTALGLAEQVGAVVLLKGADTIIAAADGSYAVCAAGSPGMAKGGSGDVLAGAIAAFLARGLTTFDAACCGAWCCGRAGEIAAGRLSATYADALDTISCLAEVFLELER